MTEPRTEIPETASQPRLRRRLGLFQAVSLNMANMVGVGPFLTIPVIVGHLPGRQVIAGWAAGLVLCLADSLMWCELGAALPGSGGTYHYLRECFRGRPLGRLLPFLFIWQFIFSGPMEVASGCIGFASYLDQLWPSSWTDLTFQAGDTTYLTLPGKVVASLIVVAALVLLYRKIESIGKLTVALWAGMVITVGLVIFTVAWKFHAAQAFASPVELYDEKEGLAFAFGGALSTAMYDFLGYYDICYLGDEVKDPGRTIPRAVIISILAVACLYATINIGVLGVLPMEQVKTSTAIAADLSRAVWGPGAMTAVIILLILWTAFASVFALLLGYSRIPYAAARDGFFFARFADLHPRKEFPRVSLLVLCGVAIVACWFPFQTVLNLLMTSRILAQFVAQVGAVVALRRNRPDVPMPFRMWLYPLPCALALAGWLFIFGTSGLFPVLFGLGTIAAGTAAYFLIFRRGRK